MSKHRLWLPALLVLVLPALSWAGAACPPAVSAAAAKAYPGAKVISCKQENEKGKVQFEVKLDTKEGKKVELDISPEGTVLLTEEVVDVATVLPAVMTAFAGKYPKARASRAEKQTKNDGSVSYELLFTNGGKRHEVTFAQDGRFIEEE